MAYSKDTLEDIRKSLLDTIAMVERENATLSAKIDSLKKPSDLPLMNQDNQKFLKDLSLTETVNGMSFRNVKKETFDDSTFKITASINGKAGCLLVVIAGADGEVKNFTLSIEDESSLIEIKEDLCTLIEDVNLSLTLKAVASFSRMDELRFQIFEELLNDYKDYFKIKVRDKECPGGGSTPDSMVVSAASKNKQAKYFNVSWYLRWNYGKLGIEHKFIVNRLQGLSKIPRLEPELRKLEKKCFIDGKCSGLIDLWRDIGKLVSEE